MKEEMMKISLKEEGAKMFQILNSGVNKIYFSLPPIPDRLWDNTSSVSETKTL
jgi:hypothetical protein